MSLLKICFSKLSIQQKIDTCPEAVRKGGGQRKETNNSEQRKYLRGPKERSGAWERTKGTQGLCDSKEKMCRAIIVGKTLEWDT